MAVALSEAEEASRQRAAQQAAVAELGRRALSEADPVEVANLACELVQDTLGVRFAGVLYDDEEEADCLLLVASTAVLADGIGSVRRYRNDALTEVLHRREPLIVNDCTDPKSLPKLDRDLCQRLGVRSLVATPIVPYRAAPGALVSGADSVGAFSPHDTTFLENLANVLAATLDSRKSMDELRHHALHDALTGLPNRTLVLDHLDMALSEARRNDTHVAVIMCDLDRFKLVNDGLGHTAGDEMLRIVAQRLSGHVRPGDTVGRFGGDEFVVVCPEVESTTALVSMAERLLGAFAEPMTVESTPIVVGASLGIAVSAHDGSSVAAAMLRNADAAMYRAKLSGRARYEIFDEEMQARASRRLSVESELRRAIAEDEFVIHYQPVISLDGGHLAGVEALLRWQHPTQGLLKPGDFLTVADEAGLIVDVGHWVLGEVTRQVARWMDQPGRVRHWTAVNLAPRELIDPGLVSQVDRCVQDSGVDPTLVWVELTEHSLIEDTTHVSSVLQALRSRGLGISLGAFGMGYSSLAHLKRLPLDALRLERAVVEGLGEAGTDDVVIASATVDMAHALRIRVVAGSVETQRQLEALHMMGCDLAQGYLISPPLSALDLESWVAASWPNGS